MAKGDPNKVLVVFNEVVDKTSAETVGNYGIDIMALSPADGYIIQAAIWKLINGTACTGTAALMASDAETYGVGYVPLPGGWAAVLLVKNDTPMAYQLLLTVVDP